MCKKQHPCRLPYKSCDLVPFQDANNIDPNNTYYVPAWVEITRPVEEKAIELHKSPPKFLMWPSKGGVNKLLNVRTQEGSCLRVMTLQQNEWCCYWSEGKFEVWLCEMPFPSYLVTQMHKDKIKLPKLSQRCFIWWSLSFIDQFTSFILLFLIWINCFKHLIVQPGHYALCTTNIDYKGK